MCDGGEKSLEGNGFWYYVSASDSFRIDYIY